MSVVPEKSILIELVEHLELPDSAYQKAEDRYKDLGEWLCRDESTVKEFHPHVFTQGSFRLGTAIKPLDAKEDYDLDLGCKLETALTKRNISQSQLKKLIGNEIELYRQMRGIKQELEEKNRCWRLEYLDSIKFHMDIVPCIPEEENQKQIIQKSILLESNDSFLAQSVADLTVSITDIRHPHYSQIWYDWNISNPQGYALWFESRMKLAEQLLQERARLLKSANIDKLPNYKWKAPLQTAIQLLKRHRDQLFKDLPDSKPISIIITTLAGKAYQGENNIEEALTNILTRMTDLVGNKKPRIPNPVNPAEDFSDKWHTTEGKKLKLEENFYLWVNQAQRDFELIISFKDAELLSEQCSKTFGINMDKDFLAKSLGLTSASNIVTPKHYDISEKPKPWLR